MRETHNIGDDTRELLVHRQVCRPLGVNQIMLVGISDAGDGFRLVRPKWPHSQVLACFGGEGQVWVNGSWKTLSAGEAYLTPPHVLSAYHTDRGKRWQLAWVTYEVSPRFSPVTCRQAMVTQGDPRPLRVAIEGLWGEANAKADHSCLQAWVDVIQRYAARIGDQSHHDRFWSVWEHVTADLARDWSVDDMAAMASVSGEQFRRLCHSQVGHTPMQHLAKLRMHRSATLLVSTRMRIESIASAVGYSNRFSFSNAFRREMGQTPANYRLHQPVATEAADETT